MFVFIAKRNKENKMFVKVEKKKNNKEMEFCELIVGDFFMWRGDLCLKTHDYRTNGWRFIDDCSLFVAQSDKVQFVEKRDVRIYAKVD
jgi:hypothetical protein